TEFRCGVEAGVDISAGDLRRDYAAIVLAGGAPVARQLPVPGADLAGIHQAMEYLPLANRAVAAADGAGGGRAGDGGQRARRRSGEGEAAGPGSVSASSGPASPASASPASASPASVSPERARSGVVPETAISAKGRHVVIIGGGDTGADCLGTALRQ